LLGGKIKRNKWIFAVMAAMIGWIQTRSRWTGWLVISICKMKGVDLVIGWKVEPRICYWMSGPGIVWQQCAQTIRTKEFYDLCLALTSFYVQLILLNLSVARFQNFIPLVSCIPFVVCERITNQPLLFGEKLSFVCLWLVVLLI
jgi:hypothetical protein